MMEILSLVPGYFFLPLFVTLIAVACAFIKVVQISNKQLNPDGLPITAIKRQNNGKTAEQIAEEEAQKIKDEEEAELYRNQSWA